MPSYYRRILLLTGPVAALAIAGCSASGGDTGPGVHGGVVTKVVTSTVPAPASTDDITVPSESPVKAAQPANDDQQSDQGEGGAFVMPNEVGKGLQAAQDDIQRVSDNPIFFTDSTDATGAGRMQILDRDWKVCGQNVPAGSHVNQDSEISFAAVKLWENCP
jgi:hypothetical protein